MRQLRLLALCLGLTVCLPLAAEEKKVEVGKAAPDVTLQATQIEKVLADRKGEGPMSLKDLKGKNVVLFFYPKAMTKGCTMESCGFRDRVDKFAKCDTVVIGISTDKLADQMKFTEKENLNFPIFADPDKKVTKAFGALSPQGYAMRYTYVIDKNGVVRHIYAPVKNAGTHPEEVLEFVEKTFGK
jgi:peroxiredoxin Q/BCP